MSAARLFVFPFPTARPTPIVRRLPSAVRCMQGGKSSENGKNGAVPKTLKTVTIQYGFDKLNVTTVHHTESYHDETLTLHRKDIQFYVSPDVVFVLIMAAFVWVFWKRI